MNIGVYFEPVDLEALDFFNGYDHPQRIINQIWYTNKNEEGNEVGGRHNEL